AFQIRHRGKPEKDPDVRGNQDEPGRQRHAADHAAGANHGSGDRQLLSDVRRHIHDGQAGADDQYQAQRSAAAVFGRREDHERTEIAGAGPDAASSAAAYAVARTDPVRFAENYSADRGPQHGRVQSRGYPRNSSRIALYRRCSGARRSQRFSLGRTGPLPFSRTAHADGFGAQRRRGGGGRALRPQQHSGGDGGGSLGIRGGHAGGAGDDGGRSGRGDTRDRSGFRGEAIAVGAGSGGGRGGHARRSDADAALDISLAAAAV